MKKQKKVKIHEEGKLYIGVVLIALIIALIIWIAFYLGNNTGYSEGYSQGYLNGTQVGYENGTNYTLSKISSCIAFNPQTQQPFILFDNQTNYHYYYLNVECLTRKP